MEFGANIPETFKGKNNISTSMTDIYYQPNAYHRYKQHRKGLTRS